MWSMTLRTRVLATAATALLLAGCGGNSARTFVGSVTGIGSHRVCVGAPEAAGECFWQGPLTSGLHANDCVQVTYALPAQPTSAPKKLQKVARVNASDHPRDCPSK